MRSPAGADPRTERIAALDGIRGVAVACVVLFHLWPSVAPGGFLGVSVFFTLSGFVITRSLLGEHARDGRVRLGAFWARRARRLLPASLATLAAVAAVWSLTGWGTRDTGRDLLAAIAQVSNWRFISVGQQYGADLDSPVLHFWSLAIEEQFYLVAPLLFALLVRRARLLSLGYGLVVGGAAVASIAWAGRAELVYYSTLTRSGEIAAGALLAVWYCRDDAPSRRRVSRVSDMAGAVALAVVAWASAVRTLGDEIWYRGGLLAFSAVSCVVLIGALRGRLVGRVLSWRPLVALGGISYGVYLAHWPLDAALRQSGISGPARPWVSLAATLAIATVSHRWLEQPVTDRRVPGRRFAALAAVGAVLVVAVGGASALQPRRADDIDFDAAQRSLASAASSSTHSSSAPDALRVGAFGDSTALMLGFGLKDGGVVYATGFSDLGCPIGRGGRAKGDITVPESFGGPPRPYPERCNWTTTWADSLAKSGPIDVAVVLAGNWDLVDRDIPGLGGWRRIGDPTYDAWLAEEINEAARLLLDSGAAHVAWLTLPAPEGFDPHPGVARFNEILLDTLGSTPGVTILDYAGHLRTAGDGAVMRPDGTHLSAETAKVLADRWLIDALTDAVRPPEPLRVGIFGDSTAVMLSTGLAREGTGALVVTGYAEAGCPLARRGRMRGDPTVSDWENLPSIPFPRKCDWSNGWPEAVRRALPLDVAVVLVGNWDLMERKIPGQEGWHRLGDPAFDTWLADEARIAASTLVHAGAAHVVWLTLPAPSGVQEPETLATFNRIVTEALSDVPGAHVLDYAGHLRAGGDDETMRPDGTHLSEETAAVLADRWLIPELIRIVGG